MIKGIEILNKTPITEMTKSGFIILIVSVIVLCLSIAFLFSFLDDRNDTGVFVCFLICLISFVTLIVGLNIRKQTGRYEYKVTMNKDVSIQDVYENYKVVEKDGKIWILEDKE